ncbi:H+/gluconate symporter-like permease [Alkalispirillum mobile]|uniref:H+/gluconate symporter-like permease n=1 Tax=Alkalispirillum mobile TaxID=85925 RepID=A0A498BS25_9GAMM|nr:GntP family permease [Alkalispirillum mobile]RLK46803.1 H+/gluconate symporter-like permease [Alkalispirillum mobile]
MQGIIGIVLSLALLMFFAYRGYSVLFLAPIMASLAVIISGEAPLLASYTQVFMQALGDFVIQFFPIFLLGAIFGKLMDASGAAQSIARTITGYLGAQRAVLAIVLACGVLTYGGVSLFVVAFAVYPIAAALFKEADIPKRLIPGAIALGAFTFTMTALPGTPAIQNAIPTGYFGTDVFAAPGLGIIAGLIMMAGGTLWLTRRASAAKGRGEGYGHHPDEDPVEEDNRSLPPIIVALIPIVLVVVFNLLFARVFIPMWDTGYLSDDQFGGVSIDDVRGIWAIIISLAIAIGATIGLNWQRLQDTREAINRGCMNSLLPIFNTASEVGYGAVIASLTAFVVIRDFMMGVSPDNPLISQALVVNVLAGITGSSSGGMSIALSTMGDKYLEMATDMGIDPELLHRVTTLAAGSLDTLPHCGAIITLLSICRLTHKQSYPDIFMVALVIPVAALVTVITLGTVFGSF